MTLSVVIPTYNRAGALLQESLVSVLEQTRPPDEIIVVCDGCTDDSPTQVQHLFDEWQWQWPRARVIQTKKNKGKSVAANIGLAQVTGDLIWVWDDDDIAVLDRCEKLVPMFEADDHLGLVHTDAQWLEPSGQVLPWESEHQDISAVPRSHLRGNMWFTISVMFRSELLTLMAIDENAETWLRHHGAEQFDQKMAKWPYDPRLLRAQDYDLWIRLGTTMLKRGYNVQNLNQVTVEARNHRGNRGPGHTITFDQIPQATLHHEKLIMKKFFKAVPITLMFPGCNEVPGIKAVAHLERAFALAERGLINKALGELKKLAPVVGELVTKESHELLRHFGKQQAITGGLLAEYLRSLVVCLPGTEPEQPKTFMI